MSNVFMRILLFFDLPSVTKKDVREYNIFVRNIKKLGFVRMQESVFTKLALNPSIVNSCMTELIFPRTQDYSHKKKGKIFHGKRKTNHKTTEQKHV